jgi:tetratricopeptide (TPR) repeat protein
MEAAGKATSLRELALDLAGVHRFDVAIQKLQQALELEPDYAEARHDLVRMRMLAQRGSAADGAHAVVAGRRRARVADGGRIGLGSARGRLDRTEAALRHDADRHPENPDAQCALAAFLVRTEHFSEALHRFQLALARDAECLHGNPEWHAAYAAVTRQRRQ